MLAGFIQQVCDSLEQFEPVWDRQIFTFCVAGLHVLADRLQKHAGQCHCTITL